MRRGEVWWAQLPEPAGRRPVVLVSRDEAYAVRSDVTVAPVTTRIRKIRTFVELGPEDGLPLTCAANFDSLLTVPKRFLIEVVTMLTRERVSAMDDAIQFALGLAPRPGA